MKLPWGKGGPGGDSAGQEGARKVGWWMWHLMDSARGADSAGRRGQGGADPTLGAGGLWMILLSTVVHAWGHASPGQGGPARPPVVLAKPPHQ